MNDKHMHQLTATQKLKNELESILERAKQYVKLANQTAEARHDDMD